MGVGEGIFGFCKKKKNFVELRVFSYFQGQMGLHLRPVTIHLVEDFFNRWIN